MPIRTLLVANRGEIAVRIIRAAADLGLRTVAVHAPDDAHALHVRMADAAMALPGQGAAAYLEIAAVVNAAGQSGCDAVHPGYGFLSESAAFATEVRRAGLRFVGPRPELLALFGDKARAIALARSCEVPVIEGTSGPTSLEQARAFVSALPAGEAVMVKAIAGGGGRGMRVVRDPASLEEAFQRCQSEAAHAFGNGDLYVERFLPEARHIEIQIVGDGRRVMHLGERECSIQRRNQKLVEIAPSPSITPQMRAALCDAAVRMARQVEYEGLGTFEFLVSGGAGSEGFAFIEVNPRLQVEHTVTEEVMDIDLVQAQLRLSAGASLEEAGLPAGLAPRGHAVQLRINMETLAADGSARPSSGVLEAFDLPSGRGVRVDTFGYTGYATSARYDSLLAKLIVHSPSSRYEDAVQRAYRALCEFRIEGVATNVPLLRSLLRHPAVVRNEVSTRFLDENLPELVEAIGGDRQLHAGAVAGAAARTGDPLAVFTTDSGLAARLGKPHDEAPPPAGSIALKAPQQGTVLSVEVAAGDTLRSGQTLLVLEAMKMEHAIGAPVACTVARLAFRPGETVLEGETLAWLVLDEVAGEVQEQREQIDLEAIRDDLAAVLARREALLDAGRPEAVAKRRATGQRTARENIADLCDDGSFVEYGGLAVAAQRSRRTVEDLLRISPADGLVTGLCTVNASSFGSDASRCAVLAYDYTVFAGTQGVVNHKKTDRLLQLATQWRLPLVAFTEGGGGRPGDDWPTPAGLDTATFTGMGHLSGLVPTVAVVSGRCFAGNAAILGACDVVIATEGTNIGMGGPAMIEGGGLGVFRPEEVGPMSVQVPNGVVDLLVRDESQAVQAARRYLSYFQGAVREWDCADQRLLRSVVPENRLRAYDMRNALHALADSGSVLELRPAFGPGMITALVRIEGKPCGVIANNPQYLGGAIDADAADKAARFIRLCDAFDLPLLSLCDTPGMMVGPKVEESAQVRHVSRLFLAAANASIPTFMVVLRKGYGLGALAMAGGSTRAPMRTVSWPTGEFGAMGLEGSVKLAYRKELAAIEDDAARKAWFDAKVAEAYEQNRALNSASYLEIDDVIDPAQTRAEIAATLLGVRAAAARQPKKRSMVDVW